MEGLGDSWLGFQGNKEELSSRVQDIPELPGVYMFRGEDGEILYVGKARNLRKRLKSYFASDLAPKTKALMERVFGLDTIVVHSEKEALILESNLIKKHRPKYNVLLKDDKHYPYLRVGVNDEWPRVTVVRRIQKDGARYFGPYTRARSVRETLNLLRKIFPYRTCSDSTLAQVSRPCLDYHIGRCLGPCTGKISRSEYMETISQVVDFLSGKSAGVRAQLVRKMQSLADELDFEGAARVRDQIRALDEVTERQKIITPDLQDRDVVGLARYSDLAMVALLHVREGKLVGRDGFMLTNTGSDEDSEIIRAFLLQHYISALEIPGEVLIPVEIEDLSAIQDYFKTSREDSRSPEVRVPQRGLLKDLVIMAQDNAKTMLEEYVPAHEREERALRLALKELQTVLGLKVIPTRIECYDISNISGNEAVASMVVMTQGKPDKSEYRRFKIRIDGRPNDFAMMQEAIYRRFKKVHARGQRTPARGFSALPDLVVVDGGIGQVNAAKEVLNSLALDLPLIGLAKRNEEIFFPGNSEPLVLPRESGALFLIMRLRDEAHRFAVSYHRKLHGEAALRSLLEDIPGVGEARLKALLQKFGDVNALARADVTEIASVKGIGAKLASRIKEELINRV